MAFTEETYAVGTLVKSANLNQINVRLKNQWRTVDLTKFDDIAGPASSTTNGVLTLKGQVQLYIDMSEFTQITAIRYRHADGATPTGQLRVQNGTSDTTGAVAVVTVGPLAAATDFTKTTNFVSDTDTLGSPFVGSDTKSFFISLNNIGVEDVVVHRVEIFTD